MKGGENIIEPSSSFFRGGRVLVARVLLEAVETGPEAKIRFHSCCCIPRYWSNHESEE
jgi:hypothetical protein